VKQKKRNFELEKEAVIWREIQKLLEAGHIREIQYPEWLSNAVLVPKAENDWRMCIYFRDLNKACPKDCHPLPRIDEMVDATSGCKLLSMVDALQGYHQIKLAVEDQKRVSFITPFSTYCYVVMPFGLKNAGATYQRLMDRMFQDQKERNVAVYVDDILVKSIKATTHLQDLEESEEGYIWSPVREVFRIHCDGKGY
jgi:Reverse transcriptase (RNA-dependent DNA polymerase)